MPSKDQLHIKIDSELKDALERKAKEDGFPTLTSLIQHALSQYLKNPHQGGSVSTDALDHFEQLLKRQQEFFSNLNTLLINASQKEKPADFDQKATRIFSLVKLDRLPFAEIVNITQMREEEITFFFAFSPQPPFQGVAAVTTIGNLT
jgi:hypothetical protein